MRPATTACLALVSLLVLTGCRNATTPGLSRPAAQVSLSWSPAAGDWTTDGTRSWAFAPTASLGLIRELEVSLTPPQTGKVTYLLTNTTAVASASATVYASSAHLLVKPVNLEVPPLPTGPFPRSAADTVAASAAAVGDTFAFRDAITRKTYATTLRHQTINSGETVNYWVQDTLWTTGGYSAATRSAGQVNSAMVQALAAKFLAASGSSDIYHGETDLLGTEWDDTAGAAAGLIATGKTLDIFLVDLNPGIAMSDGQAMYFGYFSAGNLYFRSQYSASNQRELFAVHAPALGFGASSNTWALSDPAPLEVVSTLAHEFQHMIRFYQKNVRQRVYDSLEWTNEMASMLMEDLLSSQLGTKGPRGVLGTTLTSGSPNNLLGRFPAFLAARPGVSLTGWDSTSADATLAHYAASYAFGSWLVRNWGGPALVRSMVQSADVGSTMVAAAVNDVNDLKGADQQSFATLVRQWGLAQYLGASTLVPYAYQAPGSGEFLVNGSPFSLGSIDLGRYLWTASNPAWPVVETGATPTVGSGQTAFLSAGTATAGVIWSGTTYLPPDVVLTVVVGP